MILRNLGLLANDPNQFLLIVVTSLSALILAITVHEFSHAAVAFSFGDRTAKRLGRLSLNPLVHLDPLGGAMLLLIGFGWGKPVPVNEWILTRHGLRAFSLVAFAGPLSNFITALFLAIPFQLELLNWPFVGGGGVEESLIGELTASVIGIFIFYNLLLGVFNMLPVAPLDGSKAILGVLPKGIAERYRSLDAWGPGILLTMIMFDWLLDVQILIKLIGPPVNLLSRIVAGHSMF
ncbi:site-2 protease family protein [SAR202 cluster bacterium AD-802-E10_MRT_200m]|nr:site-2 protease family protein [SAR202 cluster bacterium AD-802-E10_MRT_200m]